MRKQKGLRLEVCFQDKGQGGRKGKISAFLPLKTQPWTFAKPRKQLGGGLGVFPMFPPALLQPQAGRMDLGVLQQGLSHQPHAKHK